MDFNFDFLDVGDKIVRMDQYGFRTEATVTKKLETDIIIEQANGLLVRLTKYMSKQVVSVDWA